MDPDKALDNARKALAAYRAGETKDDSSLMWDAAVDLAEAFEALDGWLSGKGFPPRAWDQGLESETVLDKPRLDFVNNRGE